MLTKLYDEQEEKQTLEKLAEKREARKAALEMKASEKAKKLEAKASKADALYAPVRCGCPPRCSDGDVYARDPSPPLSPA